MKNLYSNFYTVNCISFKLDNITSLVHLRAQVGVWSIMTGFCFALLNSGNSLKITPRLIMVKQLKFCKEKYQTKERQRKKC